MTQEEYEEKNKRQCLNYLEESERLTAQLTKTEKALKDTISIHLVDDDEWEIFY